MKKQLLEFINKEITAIEEDSRYQDKAANVNINAPLALIQVSLSSRRNTLRQIRNEINKN